MGHRPTVRPDELRCSWCRKWKPDDEFGPSRWHKARRLRRYECRACEAERAAWQRAGGKMKKKLVSRAPRPTSTPDQSNETSTSSST